MHNNHAVSHKPKREDAKAKELADLRRENHELRRTVTRLNKEIAKFSNHEVESVDVEAEVVEQVEVVVGAICSCGLQPTELTLNDKLFLICPECKARKKVA